MITMICRTFFFILTYNLCVSADHDAVATKPDIDKLLREGDLATNFYGKDEFLVLVGGTGTGKSTLSKFLRKDPSLRIIENDQNDFIFTDNDNYVGTKDILNSKTLFPNIDEDPKTGLLFVDMAGFQDTRSAEFDLVTGFLNKKVLDSAKKLKFLLVENYVNTQLHNNRAAFVTQLKNFAHLIKGNLDSFTGSIGMVLTKIDSRKNDAVLVRSAKIFLQKVEEQLKNATAASEHEDQIKILNSILAGEKIGLFRRPNGIGDPWEQIDLKENYDQLRHIISEELRFSSSLVNTEFKVTVAPATINYMRKDLLGPGLEKIKIAFDNIYKSMIQGFYNKLRVPIRSTSKKIEDSLIFCDNTLQFLEDAQRVDEYETLLNALTGTEREFSVDLEFQIKKIKFLYSVDEDFWAAEKLKFDVKNIFGWKHQIISQIKLIDRFQMFLKSLIKDFDTYEVQNSDMSMITIRTNQNFQNFLALMPSIGFTQETVSLSLGLTVEMPEIAEVVKIIRHYKPAQVKLHLDTTNSVATFIGRYILLDKVVKNIHTLKSSFKSIVIVATNKIFVDTNLSLNDTNLALIAPIIEIIGSRYLVLAGSSGSSFENSATKGRRSGDAGDSGEDGGHGKFPGKLQILALEVKNEQLLNIHIVGGDGGNGQRGGDGYDAPQVSLPSGLLDNYEGSEEDLHKKAIDAGYIYCPKDIAEKEIIVPTIIYNHFEYYLMREITFIKRTNESAGNGSKGGDAGWGAKHIKPEILLKNRESINGANIVLRDGKPGSPGAGGLAGSILNTCSYRNYTCKSYKTSKWIAFIPVHIKGGNPFSPRDLYYSCPTSDSDGHCPTELRKVYNGRNGRTGELFIVPESTALNLYQLALKLVETSIDLSDGSMDSNLKELIRMTFSSSSILDTMQEIDFIYFLETINHSFANVVLSSDNLHFIFTQMHALFKSFEKNCTECNSLNLKLIDIRFINFFQNLHMFSKNKQIIRLNSVINAALKKIEEINGVNRNLQHTELVDNAKQIAQMEITDATFLIKETFDHKVVEANKKAAISLKNLMQISDHLRQNYTSNIFGLEEYRQKIKSALKIKAILRVINVAVDTGKAIFSVFNVLSPSALTTSVIKSAVEKGPIKSALKIISNFRNKKQASKDAAYDTASELIDADNKFGGIINSRQERVQLHQLVAHKKYNKASTNAQKLIEAVPALFKTISASLGMKIKNLRAQRKGNKRNKLSEIGTLQELSERVLEATGMKNFKGIADEIREYLSDEIDLEEVDTAIENNKLALKRIGQYETQIEYELQPLLDGLFEIFENIKSTSLPQDKPNNYIRALHNLDIKKYIRTFVSIISKFSAEFNGVTEDLREILVDLEDLMTILINTYDKVDEANRHIELKEFFGKIQSENCDKFCQLYKKVANSIESHEIFRQFVYIFIAYQQSLFPYGGEKIRIFRSLSSELARVEDYSMTVRIVKAALTYMNDDLATMSGTILNDKDKSISSMYFSSGYRTSKPFYTWPSSKFSNEIKRLLKGEKVTFVASVLTPGVKNAVKFNTAMINFTSADPQVSKRVQEILLHFTVEMSYGGESHYRCGSKYYAISGDPLDFKFSYERDQSGKMITKNSVFEKLKYSDVPLSPYTVWKFKLVLGSDPKYYDLHKELVQFADKVDLELVGNGFFVEENAQICSQDLGQFYNYFGNTL
ncbi:uncharacterized protein LOC132201395 [Neocloeon triangulifer]|uniref:uncharacterized protein LOC132201395 n=1 Tax=Neocloeon triangulifer TaxID=2078957 RepID=UPI00286F6CE9|nr:uncharacterized protein LOC132201395 [Neocloeon triangulifer]